MEWFITIFDIVDWYLFPDIFKLKGKLHNKYFEILNFSSSRFCKQLRFASLRPVLGIPLFKNVVKKYNAENKNVVKT
jgi:hypothetical protein